MKRRRFIELSATVSALAASGRLPLLAGENNPIPPAIEPVSSAVRNFIPKSGSFVPRSGFGLVYEFVRWRGKKDDGTVINQNSGELRIQRNGGENAAHYNVQQEVLLPNQQEIFLTASLDVEGRFDSPKTWTVERWQTDPEKTIQEAARLRLSGEVKNGEVRICSDGNVMMRCPLQEPLVLQWAVPSVLASSDVKKEPLDFCMLDEGLKIKPSQKIEYCGEIPVPTAQGDVALDAYLQTGFGTLPVHWLVDADGRTQLMTHSVLNWLLMDVG